MRIKQRLYSAVDVQVLVADYLHSTRKIQQNKYSGTSRQDETRQFKQDFTHFMHFNHLEGKQIC